MADTKISDLTSASTPLAGDELIPIVQSSTTKQATVQDVQTLAVSVVSATTYTILNADSSVFYANASANTVTVTLPDLSENLGRRITVRASDATETITIERAGSDTIANGQTFVTITEDRNTITFEAGPDQWEVSGPGYMDKNIHFANGFGIDFSASEGGGATSSVLDDYEEGTWTPEVSGFTVGNGKREGKYTKIGNLVTVSFRITFGSTSSAITMSTCTNLPFAVVSGDNQTGVLSLLETGINGYGGFISIGLTSLNIRYQTDGAVAEPTATAPFTFGTNDFIHGSITYTTTA